MKIKIDIKSNYGILNMELVMAIFLGKYKGSKQRGYDKYAISQLHLCREPFLLEDIMNEKMAQNKARREANEMMRKLYPNIDWHIYCVHHKDKNPYNNEMSNLLIMKRAVHTRLHCKGIPSKQVRPRKKNPQIKTLVKDGNWKDSYQKWQIISFNGKVRWEIQSAKYNKQKDITTIKLKKLS